MSASSRYVMLLPMLGFRGDSTGRCQFGRFASPVPRQNIISKTFDSVHEVARQFILESIAFELSTKKNLNQNLFEQFHSPIYGSKVYDLIMVDKATFETLIDDLIRTEFKTSYPAFAEVSSETINDLYNGKADEYLDTHSGDSDSGSYHFDPTATVAAIVPIVNLLKLIAETYLSIKKSLSGSEKSSNSTNDLEGELTSALTKHLGKAKATIVAKKIASDLAAKSK